MVELDARRTADGAVAVHHDPAIPGLGALCTLHFAQLSRKIPRLGDAIAACQGMSVNIEIKNLPGEPDFDPDERLADAVVDVVRERGVVDRVLVSSFRLATIDRVHAVDPPVATAWLVLPGRDDAEVVAACAERGHVALHPHHAAVTAELVDTAHAAGLRVNTWTVDDADRMRELAALGVDGIVTNDVATAVAVLNGGTRR
jgi:glycerophosphoryl diester phosphodiesterase